MPTLRSAVLLVGAVAVAAGIGGFVAGADAAGKADWHTATVEVVGESAHPLVSVEVDGWTYAIDESLPYWIDAAGVHEGGWPTCLSPNPPGPATQVPLEVPIRFASMHIQAEGVLTWRQVVAVDCRPAG